MSKTFTLHDLPLEERPRERLKLVGVNNLSLQELLALIIEKGGRNQNALQVSQNLLSFFGNLAKIKEASLEELKQVKGVGNATACKLQAAFKIGEKAAIQIKESGSKITSSADIFNMLKNRLTSKKKEHFLIISLNSRHQVIGIDNISVGTINASIAHPREVFKTAITNCATAIILVHNHPSGETKPSAEDFEITRRLIEAGTILGIKIIDHLIFSDYHFLSLKDQGLMEF